MHELARVLPNLRTLHVPVQREAQIQTILSPFCDSKSPLRHLRIHHFQLETHCRSLSMSSSALDRLHSQSSNSGQIAAIMSKEQRQTVIRELADRLYPAGNLLLVSHVLGWCDMPLVHWAMDSIDFDELPHKK